MEDSSPADKKKKPGGIMEMLRTLLWAGAIALVVRTFAFEPFNIPSGSMIPSLLIGDYLFVSKYAYGYSRHSLPFSLPLIPGRVLYSAPERGDVVVYKQPQDPGVDFIKRVMGLPGDRIQMRAGRVYINDVPVARERIEDFGIAHGGRRRMVPQFLETLPDGRVHRILEVQGDVGGRDNTPVFEVPADHFFMMGDNRDNSQDSRAFPAQFRFVPRENLVGRAEFLFFSKNTFRPWYDVTAIRFGRIFGGIE